MFFILMISVAWCQANKEVTSENATNSNYNTQSLLMIITKANPNANHTHEKNHNDDAYQIKFQEEQTFLWSLVSKSMEDCTEKHQETYTK